MGQVAGRGTSTKSRVEAARPKFQPKCFDGEGRFYLFPYFVIPISRTFLYKQVPRLGKGLRKVAF